MATAASKALPPAFSISIPASVASGSALAIAALPGTFREYVSQPPITTSIGMAISPPIKFRNPEKRIACDYLLMPAQRVQQPDDPNPVDNPFSIIGFRMNTNTRGVTNSFHHPLK
jgi:hypothetical protein